MLSRPMVGRFGRAILIAVLLVLKVLLLWTLESRQMPALDIWHTTSLTSEFTARDATQQLPRNWNRTLGLVPEKFRAAPCFCTASPIYFTACARNSSKLYGLCFRSSTATLDFGLELYDIYSWIYGNRLRFADIEAIIKKSEHLWTIQKNRSLN
jgi:hypothetical protein